MSSFKELLALGLGKRNWQWKLSAKWWRTFSTFSLCSLIVFSLLLFMLGSSFSTLSEHLLITFAKCSFTTPFLVFPSSEYITFLLSFNYSTPFTHVLVCVSRSIFSFKLDRHSRVLWTHSLHYFCKFPIAKKRDGQNANHKKVRPKCQPLVGILSIWYFVRWHFVQTPSHLNEHEYNCQPHGKTHPTKLGLFIWQNPLDGKTHRRIHGKTHGTIQVSIIWQNPLDGKSHWGSCHDFPGANPY